MFKSPEEHLRAELARLDLLLHREILRLRARYQLSLDEFRGLYISDSQVDELIRHARSDDSNPADIERLCAEARSLRRENYDNLPEDFPWNRLAKEFDLSAAEQDVLLLAIAPELDQKYETLYAYLNNDVSRKWPTIGLAVRLADDAGQRTAGAAYLYPEGTLFTSGLLQVVQQQGDKSSRLARGISLSPVASQYLVGQDVPGSMPVPNRAWGDVLLPDDVKKPLRNVARLYGNPGPRPLLLFEGRRGSGKKSAAEAICSDMGIPLLALDAELCKGPPGSIENMMTGLALRQRLLKAGVYVEDIEALLDREGGPLSESSVIIRQLARMTGPVFLSADEGTAWKKLVDSRQALVFSFKIPGFADRLAAWNLHLQRISPGVRQSDLEALADRFLFTPGEIGDVVESGRNMSVLRCGEPSRIGRAALFEAARGYSAQRFGPLAMKVETIHGWEDLVLPPVTLRQVKEVAAAAKYRHIVYSHWNFERRISSGKGLTVLFSGASGTGKTMAAGVIAREMELDLYRVDLSGLVSKYIGETEKNLDRVFRAARAANAILFFDEADALFGKRSEVKDAHDRYANVEVAYLLMKMEEHEGIVVLASNLSKNIDQSFSRRLRYVVEFPLPDEANREKLWRNMFPREAPMGQDVDFEFLARQFEFAGGDIRNVALDAAFLAAQDGRVITMKQIVTALARQTQKQKRVVSPSDFKQYYGLLELGA